MAQNNKPLYTLYESLKSDNYDVPEDYDSFESTLTAPGADGTKNRLTLYKSLKDDGYDVPDTYDSFANTLFAAKPRVAREQQAANAETESTGTTAGKPAAPGTKADESGVSSVAGEANVANVANVADEGAALTPVGNTDPMTIATTFSGESRQMVGDTGRMLGAMTPDGRKKQQGLEMAGRMAGRNTRLPGLSVAMPAPEQPEASEGAQAAPKAQDMRGPQYYGTVVDQEDGQTKGQWLMPDGSLTTDFYEADVAAGEARSARLRREFERRMVINGLDTSKPEDVAAQQAYDQLAQLEARAKMHSDEKLAKLEERYEKAGAMERGRLLIGQNGNTATSMVTMPASVYGNGIYDDEDKLIAAERKNLEDAITAHHAGKLKKTGSFFAAQNLVNAWEGVKDVSKDGDTYTAGMTSMHQSAQMLAIKAKLDKGEALTRGEESLLESMLVKQTIDENVEKPHGYTMGYTIANMVPFMIQMAMNPAAGAGEKLGNMAVKDFAKIMAKRAGRRATQGFMMKAVAKLGKKRAAAIAKGIGVTAGDIVASAGLANTLQAPATMADAALRHVGDVAYDKDGTLHFEAGDGVVKAFYKAEMASLIENYTEMLGAHFGVIGGAIGRGTGKAVRKLGGGRLLDNVMKLCTNIQATDWAKGIAAIERRAQWNGSVGEVLEEEAGIVLNSIFTGDNSISDLWDKEQQIDIVLGVGAFGAFVSGIKTAGYPITRHRVRKALDERAATCEASFGKNWDSIRETIDMADEADLAQTRARLGRRYATTPERAKALLEYASAMTKARAFNIASASAEELQTTPEQRQINQSYNNGYTAEGSGRADVQNLYNAQRERALNTLDADTMRNLDADPLATLSGMASAGTYTDEELSAAREYAAAKSAYDGMQQSVEDEIEAQIWRCNAAIDARTNRDTGMVQRSTYGLEDREVYIIKGNVVADENGVIDRSASDDTIAIVDLETGETKMVASKDLGHAEQPIEAEQFKSSMAAYVRQEIGDRARAQAEGRLLFDENEKCLILDDEGSQSEVTILGDATDEQGAPIADAVKVQYADGTTGVVAMSELQEQVNAAAAARMGYAEQERQQGAAARAAVDAEADTDAEQDGLAGGEGGQRRSFALNDEVELIDDQGDLTSGTITGELDADGFIVVQTDKPVNGQKVNRLTLDELMQRLTRHNGEIVDEAEVEGEPRSPEPPAGGELNPTGAEPPVSGGGTSDDSRGVDPTNQKPILRLDETQANDLVSQMEAKAEPAELIEFNADNWLAQFGEEGKVQTPLGEVKLGENQYGKLALRKRTEYFGMIKPTLENPDVIIEKQAPAEGAERDTKYLFIKTFVKHDGSRVVHFESVTVRKEGMEVSISSHEAEAKDIKKEMQKENILHLNEKLSLGSERSLTEAQPSEGPDLVPTSDNLSDGKDINSASEKQADSKESLPKAGPTALERLPKNEKGGPIFEKAESPEAGWDALVEFSDGDASAAKENADIMAKIKRKALEKVRKQKPKGDNPTVIRESQTAIAAALAKAEQEYDVWIKVASVEQERKAEERRREDEAARARARERAEAEKVEREAREEAARQEREALHGVPEITADNPADARKRGYVRWRGQKIDRQEPTAQDDPGLGKEVEPMFRAGDQPVTERGRMYVGEVEDFAPSHVDGEMNPRHFGPEWQPKKRHEDGGVSVDAAKKNASNINPALVTRAEDAFAGAPVVNSRREGIQGNGRLQMLRYLYELYPEKGEMYKQYLIDHAEQFGVSVEYIVSLKHPIVAIMLDVDDERAKFLGNIDDKDMTSGGTERIKPQNTVQKMGSEIRTFAGLLLRTADDDATFAQLIEANGAEVLRWLNQNGFITNTQYASAFDSRGKLTANAAEDLKAIMYQSIFTGGSTRLQEMFNRMPSKAQRAILATAFRDFDSPEASRMIEEIQQSIMAFDALMGYGPFRDATNGELAMGAVEAWKQQYSFDDVSGESYLPSETFSNFALTLAALYKGYTQKYIQSKFNEMFDLIQGTHELDIADLAEGKTEADYQPISLAEAVRRVLDIDYQPIDKPKTSENGTNGSDLLGVDAQDGQAGESRGAGRTESAERTTGETESAERGRGAEGDKPSLLDAVRTLFEKGKAAASKLFQRSFFDVVETPDFMKALGLTGDKFTIRYGVIARHIGKDADHEIPEEIWTRLPEALKTPFAITKYFQDGQKKIQKGYRLYTSLRLSSGAYVVVSAEVKNAGRELEVNAINTIFGREALSDVHDELIYKSDTITPEQQSLLDGNNPHQYPATRELSDRKDNNSASDKQEEDVKSSVQERLAAAEGEVNTEPTEAQKKAGNYKMGHVKIDGLQISIENPKGSMRRGKDPNGTPWETEMKNTYGYIKGPEGVDGDKIDVFLSDNPTDGDVYVVDQYNTDGTFDEHKVMYGFTSASEAEVAYLSNYSADWAKGRKVVVTGVTRKEFKKWLDASDRKKKPFAEYKSVKPIEAQNGGAAEAAKLRQKSSRLEIEGAEKLSAERAEAVERYAEGHYCVPIRVIADEADIHGSGLSDVAVAQMMAALTEEDVPAVYCREDKKIYIFAGHKDSNVGSTLAHENAHALADAMPDDEEKRQMFETYRYALLADLDHGEDFSRIWKAVADAYPPHERAEEFVAYTVGLMYVSEGAAKAIRRILDGNAKSSIFQQLINPILYGTQTKTDAYRSANSENRRGGGAGVQQGRAGNSQAEGRADGEESAGGGAEAGLTATEAAEPRQKDDEAELNSQPDGGGDVRMSIGVSSEANAAVYQATKGMLESAGVKVHEVGNQEALAMLEKKNTPVAGLPNRANEKQPSGSVLAAHSGGSSSNATDSRKSEVKIDNNTRSAKNKIKKFKNGDFDGDYSTLYKALSSMGNLLSMRNRGGSRYTILRTDKGDAVAIRLSDHRANGNNFGRDVADRNLSIVIERKRYDVLDSEIEFTEVVIPLQVFEMHPKAVVSAIVNGVDDVLADKPFTLDESLGTVIGHHGNDVRFHIRTYHGTGAEFDRVDFGYVGSGEGAQAFGWGGYVTEVKGIGKSYASAIGGKELLPKIERVAGNIRQVRQWLGKNEEYNKYARNAGSHLRELQLEYRAAEKEGNEKDLKFYGGLIELQEESMKPENHAALIANKHRQIDDYQKELKDLEAQLAEKRHLYTVRIPDDTGDNYLDWDGGVTDSVRDKIVLQADAEGVSISFYGDEMAAGGYFAKMGENAAGFQLYGALVQSLGSDKAASGLLSRAGLTGIKYAADRNNGGRADGKKNYVVFKEDDMRITGHVRFLKGGAGTVYGWVAGGEVYLNRDAMNPETPVHEYTHLWDEMVRRENPELWARGVELMKQTPLWNEVLSDPNYADIRQDEDAIASEVHARLTGSDGAKLMEEMIVRAKKEGVFEIARAVSLVDELKRWLSDMFRSLKKTLDKWSARDLRNLTVESFNRMTLRDLAEGKNPRSAIISREATERGLRFHAAMARGREAFDALRDRAVAERGIVMPGLNEKVVRVVEVPRHDFAGTGKEALNKALVWAKKNIVGVHSALDNDGREFNYSISNDAVEKYVSRSATSKSDNIGVHLAALKKLPEIIKESIEVEIHADYKKLSGERSAQNEVNVNALIHRFFGVVNIDGNLYRVKTTMREYADVNMATVAHSYEITQIELLEAPSDSTKSMAEPLAMTSNSSKVEPTVNPKDSGVPHRIANLLKGVEKSYDPGKKLLEESEKSELFRRGDERGSVGRDRFSEKRQAEFAAQEREHMAAHIRELAERLHLDNVEVVTDASQLEGVRATAKGFFNKRTGKITIVVPNNLGTIDAEQTLLHEAVAHYGLRKLLGERFDTFLDNVYESATEEIRRKIAEMAARNGWNFRTATEEYLAGLAETTNFEAMSRDAASQSWWAKVKQLFIDMVEKIGFKGFRDKVGVSLTDNELRYILWRSYANLAEPGATRSIFGEAADIARQAELKVGNYAEGGIEAEYVEPEDVADRIEKLFDAAVAGDLSRGPIEIGRLTPEGRDFLEKLSGKTLKENVSFVLNPSDLVHIYRRHFGANEADSRNTPLTRWDIRQIAEIITSPDKVLYGKEKDGNQRNMFFFLKEAEGGSYNLMEVYADRRGNLTAKSFFKSKEGVSQRAVLLSESSTLTSVTDGATLLDGAKLPKFFDNPIVEEETLVWADKKKGLEWLRSAKSNSQAITTQTLDDAAKKVKEFENPKFEEEELYRPGDFSPRDTAIARKEYERMVSSGGFQFQEAMQDSMLGLKKFYQAILGNDTQIEDVAGFENAYLFENRMSSMNAGEQHEYFRRFMEPLLKEIAKIAGANQRKRKELTDYLMAKHGLERNEHMRNEAAAKGEKTDRDFAGLIGLTGEADWRSAEATAKQWVDDYEKLHNTADLWKAINNATKATLEKIYLSGIISKKTYEEIRDMYEYYIPLRGWNETTSDQVYGYLTSKDGPLGGSIMKKAEGRSSMADDPIATIAMMADDAIRQGNRNLMKQRFLNFVLNHPSDVASVHDIWLEYDDVADEWRPVFADVEATDTADEVAQKVEAFEQRMESLKGAHPDKYKKGREAQHIPYKVVKNNLREHQVLIKRNGQTFVVTINGNPRAAQVLNGLTNPDVELNNAVGDLLKLATWANRQLSAFYTTRNPDFVVSNFMRDMLYTNCMTWVKESPRYALRFHKNFGKFAPISPRRLVRLRKGLNGGTVYSTGMLLRKWENGTLDMTDKYEKYFYEFMMNGGETGYTNVRDIEGHKRAVAAELKKQSSVGRQAWAALGMQLDLLNRSVENCARFAAFVTSREFGRSIDRAIYDAKEVSVNFNKKGSGAKMAKAVGQTNLGKFAAYLGGFGRLAFIFWNAGIQGMANFGRQAKRHPAKFAAGATAMFTLGYIIPILAEMMGGGDGDDDDKNAYYNLAEYVRRSNICFRAGGQWISIPLPIEYRAMYGLGELAYGAISGNERYSNKELAREMAAQVSQILPIDMLEGGGGLHAIIPSAFKPFTEAYIMNEEWTGLPIYKDNEFNKNDPEWTKAYASTDKHLVDFTRWLNETTGGDDYKKGEIDINPAKLEYLLSGTFGGLFTFPNRVKKSIETAAGSRDFEWRNMPIANRLIKSGDERTAYRKLQNEYYKYLEEYKETKRLHRKYDKADKSGVLGYAEKLDFLENSPEFLRAEIFDGFKDVIDANDKALKDGPDDEIRAEIEAELLADKRELVNALNDPEAYFRSLREAGMLSDDYTDYLEQSFGMKLRTQGQ